MTMNELIRQTAISLRGTVVILVLCCGLYPMTVFVLGRVLFPHQANGSLVDRNGSPATPDAAVGSSLLAQGFKSPEYFHPRPSSAGAGYDAANSSGSNLGPLSEKLLNGVADDPQTKDVDESFAGVKQLVEAYRTENDLSNSVLVPADAVTRSGSGLDPHITPANAKLQIARVAKARAVSEDAVRSAVAKHTEGPTWGIFGDPRVNVLMLNLALDRELPKPPTASR